MKKILKWIGILLAAIVTLLVIMGVVVYISSSSDLNRRYDIQPVAIDIPAADSAALSVGEHVARTRCTGCHGDNLGGRVMVDDRAFGRISSSNLTRGEGGIGNEYSDEDWIRAIRHAVGPDGSPLLVMPAQELIHLGREDLAAVIAYIKQVPAADWSPPEQKIGPMARAMHFFVEDFPMLGAATVDHSTTLTEVPPRGPTAEYGRYLSSTCIGCHGPDLTGAANGPPGTPPSANLTRLQAWSGDDFVRGVREGIRPTGDTLHAMMPRFQSFTDDEIGALWAYLSSMEPADGIGD
ncbi:MAG: c-type cytochrome [Rhodothermales bacterium]|nr:c-type cytochrome [Rhodothermales bacterium]